MTSGTATLISAEQFYSLVPERAAVELVRGELVEMSPAGFWHGRVTLNAAYVLEAWARRTRSGRTVAGEAGVITERNPDTVRGADVAYFSYSRLPAEQEPRGFADAPPELVVEVAGREQGWDESLEKVGEYLRLGVDRVWIIDPQRRALHVFRSDAPPAVYTEAEMIEDAAILPGFSCRVDEFFEKR